MAFSNTKSIIGIFVLFTFLYAGVLGLVSFSHGAGMPMANCPYTTNGYSICDSNLNHVDNWQKFLSVTLSALVVLLLAVAFFCLVGSHNVLNTPFRFSKLENEKLYSPRNKIIKWLSLLENSPSLISVRA